MINRPILKQFILWISLSVLIAVAVGFAGARRGERDIAEQRAKAGVLLRLDNLGVRLDIQDKLRRDIKHSMRRHDEEEERHRGEVAHKVDNLENWAFNQKEAAGKHRLELGIRLDHQASLAYGLWDVVAANILMNEVHKERLDLLEKEPDYQAMVDATVLVKRIDQQGWGSGVFINDNVVLTAKHVVRDGIEPLVIEYQDVDYKILKVYTDKDSDLAMLLTEEVQELSIAQIMSYDKIKLGDTVYAVGSPLHFSWKFNLTKGIVSHLSRTHPGGEDVYDKWGWSHLFGYDAHGAPGSSGGPIFIDGKLAGLCVAGYSREGGSMVLGIPASEFN